MGERGMDALTPHEVTRYYRWLLDRDPEPEVLRHYEASGLRRLQLVQMIVASDEFAQRLHAWVRRARKRRSFPRFPQCMTRHFGDATSPF